MTISEGFSSPMAIYYTSAEKGCEQRASRLVIRPCKDPTNKKMVTGM